MHCRLMMHFIIEEKTSSTAKTCFYSTKNEAVRNEKRDRISSGSFTHLAMQLKVSCSTSYMLEQTLILGLGLFCSAFCQQYFAGQVYAALTVDFCNFNGDHITDCYYIFYFRYALIGKL